MNVDPKILRKQTETVLYYLKDTQHLDLYATLAHKGYFPVEDLLHLDISDLTSGTSRYEAHSRT